MVRLCDRATRIYRPATTVVACYDSEVALETEVDDILRELLREPGALAAALIRQPDAAEARFAEVEPERLVRAPLGQGAELVVAVAQGAPVELPSAIERAARELRSALRRHQSPDTQLLEVALTGKIPRSRAALLRKIERLLAAFAATHGAVGVALIRAGEVVAVGGVLDEAHLERLAFLRKRVDAEASRFKGKTSHAEVIGDDVFACSFWFDAYLMVFFDRAWSTDFVRHRARVVTRELAVVLPHLDDDPHTPADVKPLPPRPERVT
jgi:hypothetical protein